MTDVAAIFEKAFTQLEDGGIDEARESLAAAKKAGVAVDDARYLHLQGLIAWADGDVEDAAALLEQAVDAGPEDPRIFLDAGELLADIDELDTAEAVFRRLLERTDLDIETAAEARMLLAQVRLDHSDPDPDEAIELLDGVDASLQRDSGYVSLRAAATLQKGDVERAIALLDEAISRDDDIELRYQLGLACRSHGHDERGTVELLRVRDHDMREAGTDASATIPADEVEDLRRRAEDVIDTLPDPIMALVASGPIRVQRWIDEAHVRSGVDPRSAVAFEGTPATREASGDGQLLAIVVFRDVLVDQIDDDDDIADAIALGVLEELTRFFKLENLEFG